MNNFYKCNQTPPTFLPNILTLRMLITVQRNLHASVSLCMHPNSSAESMAKITKRVCTLVLRLMAAAATLLAAIVMVTSHQRTSIFGVSFEVKYNHTPAFQYFVIANAIATVYGFLVLFLPSESQLWRLVVALDVVITVLLSSSFSAALAIGDVGKHGNSYAGWQPICGQVPKYCDQVKAALISSFVGLIIYLLLLLYAIHTVLDPLLLKKT